MNWDATTNMTQNRWVNLSITVSIERFLQYPDEPTQNPTGRIIKQILMHLTRIWFNTEEKLVSVNILSE